MGEVHPPSATRQSPRLLSAPLRLCVSIVLAILCFLGGDATAAEPLSGPQPCAPRYARDWQLASAAPSLMQVLAQAVPNLDSPTLGPWFTDLLKVLAVLFFLVAGAEKVRGLFGRTPPIHVELETMRSQIIPKKKLQEDFAALADALARIEEKQHDHSETLAANTAIRDANGERLIEVATKQDAMNDNLNRLIGRLEAKKA